VVVLVHHHQVPQPHCPEQDVGALHAEGAGDLRVVVVMVAVGGGRAERLRWGRAPRGESRQALPVPLPAPTSWRHTRHAAPTSLEGMRGGSALPSCRRPALPLSK
jgi:hypothetical protein